MEHDEAAVAGHGIDIPIADGMLHAQRAGDFITHAGVAVLHVIGVHASGPPHALHVAGQRARRADDHIIGINAFIDDAQYRCLCQVGVQILCEAESRGGVGIVNLGDIVWPEADAVQPSEFLFPAGDGLVHLSGVGCLVAIQRSQQSGQSTFGVGHHGHGGVHLQRLEFGNVDVYKFCLIVKEPLGGGSEVGIAGADADDNICVPGDLIGGGAARHADTAQIQRVIPHHGALTGLSLTEGDAGGFGEGPEFLMGLAVAHAAAADQQRLLCRADQRRGFLDGLRLGQAASQAVNTFAEKADRIVVGLSFHILRHGDAYCAGVGRVGEHAHGADHRAHQLFRARNAVPVAADGAESIVCGEGEVVSLFHLLQHRVRLAAGVHIAGQDQYGDVVCCGGGGGSHHVGSAGAHRTGNSHNLFALALAGESHGGVRHALLVLALPDRHAVCLLCQRLAQTYHVAVSGQHDDTLHKGVLDTIIGDVLVFQEADQGLRHGQSYGFHAFTSFSR